MLNTKMYHIFNISERFYPCILLIRMYYIICMCFVFVLSEKVRHICCTGLNRPAAPLSIKRRCIYPPIKSLI